MRTTIDIPDDLFKKAKKRAVEEGITLKKFFKRALAKELSHKKTQSEPPWKHLRNSGSAASLKPEESGFEGYNGPDWNHSIQVNEPKDRDSS